MFAIWEFLLTQQFSDQTYGCCMVVCAKVKLIWELSLNQENSQIPIQFKRHNIHKSIFNAKIMKKIQYRLPNKFNFSVDMYTTLDIFLIRDLHLDIFQTVLLLELDMRMDFYSSNHFLLSFSYRNQNIEWSKPKLELRMQRAR